MGALEELEYLGEGAFGVAHRVLHEGQEAVMKVPRDTDYASYYAHEALVLGHLAGAGGAPRLLLLDKPEAVKIVMTFSGPKTLQQLVDDEVLTEESALQVALSAARQLKEVHAKGVVHNDIKADNVVVQPAPGQEDLLEAAFIDFGLAKFMGGKRPPEEDQYLRYGPAVLCEEGDARDDVISLGEMLTEALDDVYCQRGLGRLPDHLARLFQDVSSLDEVIQGLEHISAH